MMRDNDRKTSAILACVGVIPVVWLALAIAPSVQGGLPKILPALLSVFNNPLHIELCEDSLRTVLVLLICYGMGIGIYFSTRRNYRRREEHGSAKWGEAKTVNKKYHQHPYSDNKLMTQNVSIGLNAKKHRRNLNTLVCGGSGAGKTRFYCKPNLMQANTSFVILDPKGEIIRDTGHLLEQKGYEVRVLDLITMSRSHCYNPFVYLQNDNDIQRLVTNFFKSTTPKGSQSNDPFWDTAASMLMLALIFYLHYEAPSDEQNFAMVMEMLQAGAIENEEDPKPTALDDLFYELEMDEPDHITVERLCELTGLKREDVIVAMDANLPVNYLSQPIGDDGVLGDVIEDAKSGEVDVNRIENNILRSSLLEKLEGDERKLIYLRYVKNLTQGQIAEHMNMNQVAVSRMEKKILETLRRRVT